MQPIQIQNTKADLTRQFKFIKALVYKQHYKKLHLYLAISLGLATIIVTGLMYLTSPNSLITIKAIFFILLIIIWILAMAYAIWYFVKMTRVNSWITSVINKALLEENKYSIYFDDQKIFFLTKNIKSEVLWTYYKYFAEDSESIYLFPENESMYSCTSFSNMEIGIETLANLKEIAKVKLEKLTY
jgi:hypothetical protein